MTGRASTSDGPEEPHQVGRSVCSRRTRSPNIPAGGAARLTVFAYATPERTCEPVSRRARKPARRRELERADHARRRATVRTMFAIYCSVIAVGIVVYLIVGIVHR